MRPCKLTNEQLEYIYANYPKMSSVKLGKKFKVNHTTILFWLKRKGIPRNKTKAQKLTDQEIHEICQMYPQITIRDLSYKFKVTRNTISYWLKQNGIKIIRGGWGKREKENKPYDHRKYVASVQGKCYKDYIQEAVDKKQLDKFEGRKIISYYLSQKALYNPITYSFNK